jgi:hypothetical protein
MPPPLPAHVSTPPRPVAAAPVAESAPEPAKKSLPPVRPPAKKAEPAQSAPEILVDERPRVARQAPQPEQPSRGLLLPLAVIALVGGGGYYLWSTANADARRAPTASITEPPPATSAQASHAAFGSASATPSALPNASADITILDVAPAPQGAGRLPQLRSLPDLLSAANAARAKGDNVGARELYNRVLSVWPANVEANAGIGSVAHAEGDLAGARASYQRALAQSPGFYPAILGLADTEWELGDRASAQLRYAEIMKMPQTAPERVRERAGVVSAPAHTSAPEMATSSSPTPPVTPAERF